MKTDTNRSQRRSQRYQVELSVRVQIPGDPTNSSFQSTGSDISEGGLSVFIPREVAVGVTVTLVLRLPYSREGLRIRGVVRNRRGFNYGIEFLDCSAIHRQLITKNCRVLALLE